MLPDGEPGELVFTSLTKEAMPVIRYRTRDLTRLLPGTARPMRRMEKITGRTDDMMIVRGVNVFPTQIEELILAIAALTAHYLFVLTREGRLDELEVQVEARPDTDAAACAAAGAELAHEIKSRIGVTAEVVVLEPGGSSARWARRGASSTTARKRRDPLAYQCSSVIPTPDARAASGRDQVGTQFMSRLRCPAN